MKKLLLVCFSLLFVVNFISAWSYDNEYCDGSACAYASVTGGFPLCDGQVKTETAGYLYGGVPVCIGKLYLPLSFEGDKFYIKFEATSWGSTSSSGVSGMTEITNSLVDGKYYIEGDVVKRYIIQAWDEEIRVDSGKGYYTKYTAWASKGGGYLGTGVLSTMKTGECVSGEEYCDGMNYYTCKNLSWNLMGLQKGKCGVECLLDSDCAIEETEKYCSEGNLYLDTKAAYCSSRKCKTDISKNLIEYCEKDCILGQCIDYTIEDKLPSIIIGISFSIAFLLVFFIILKKKSKRSKK